MTSDESRAEIKRLLEMYAGVTSAGVFRSENVVNVYFRCCDFASLMAIAECAAWSNLTIRVCGISHPLCYEDEGVTDCQFMMAAPDSQTTDDQHSDAAIFFGIYLTRDLEARAILSKADAVRLHRMWNAAVPWEADE